MINILNNNLLILKNKTKSCIVIYLFIKIKK